MSYEAINYVLNDDTLKGNERILMIVYAHHQNDNGLAWPGVTLLAKECNISTRQVQRLRQKLYDSGHLILITKGHGRGNPDIASVPIKGDIWESPFSEEIKGDISAIKGDISEEKVTNQAIKGDIAMSPELKRTPIERKTTKRGESSYRILHCDQPTAPAPPIVTDSADFDGPRTNATVKAKAQAHQKHLQDPKWYANTQFGLDVSKLVDDRIPKGTGSTPLEVWLEHHDYSRAECAGFESAMEILSETIADLSLWREVVKAWSLKPRYDQTNFMAMRDWYNDPGKFRSVAKGKRNGTSERKPADYRTPNTSAWDPKTVINVGPF